MTDNVFLVDFTREPGPNPGETYTARNPEGRPLLFLHGQNADAYAGCLYGLGLRAKPRPASPREAVETAGDHVVVEELMRADGPDDADAWLADLARRSYSAFLRRPT